MSEWRMEFDGSRGWSGYAPLDDDEPLGGRGGRGSEDHLRLSDVGKLARRTRRRVVGIARADDEPTFHRLLADHLAAPLEELAVVEETWPAYELVNIQLGIDAWLAQDGRRHRLVGLRDHRHQVFGLTDLLQPSGHGYGPRPGNVSWSTLASGPDGAVTRAVRAGLYLVEDDGVHAAVLVLAADPESGMGSAQLHVVADRDGAAARIAADLRRLALEHNVFRGQLISFGHDMFGERGAALQFHTRPTLTADDVILPGETLTALRRQVVGVAEHRKRLLAARQHLKRGLLLYGPPGVGKTHSVRYLTGQLEGVTVIELSGESLGLIETACSVARTLQPSMIVVEDVDLIAEEREHFGSSPVLFQLLNEMDGLAEDVDVVFLLTTNRVEILEPALAARPGRVDQAVAMELPDADARRRLFELYRGALQVDLSRLDTVIESTEGVTASFLKELLRRAALICAETTTDPELAVSADHLDTALAELLDTRNAMTRVLLGGGRGPGSPPAGHPDDDLEEYDAPGHEPGD